jgi:hypothetical protein
MVCVCSVVAAARYMRTVKQVVYAATGQSCVKWVQCVVHSVVCVETVKSDTVELGNTLVECLRVAKS